MTQIFDATKRWAGPVFFWAAIGFGLALVFWACAFAPSGGFPTSPLALGGATIYLVAVAVAFYQGLRQRQRQAPRVANVVRPRLRFGSRVAIPLKDDAEADNSLAITSYWCRSSVGVLRSR